MREIVFLMYAALPVLIHEGGHFLAALEQIDAVTWETEI